MSEITESLKRMDGRTIRKFIMECEAYLHEQSFLAVVAMLKAAVGLSLPAIIERPNEVDPIITMRISVEDRWKDIGKLIVAAGTIMSKADVPLVVKLGQGHLPETNVKLCASAFTGRFNCLLELQPEETMTARELLTALDQKE